MSGQEARSAACASCGAAVNVPTSAAWPERCPKCGAAPFSTSSGAPLGSGMGGGDSGSLAVPRPSSAAQTYDPEARRRANHTLLSALLALWDMVPEERFGQFVMNLSREPGGFADTWEWKHGAWLERINARYVAILEARDAAK